MNKTETDQKGIDLVARRMSRVALALGSLGLILGGVGMVEGSIALYQNYKTPVVRDVDPQLAQDLEENLVGDCMNEKIMRRIVGAEDVGLEDCRKERAMWAEQERSERLTPTPPVSG